jgi:hypothetical protein
MREHPDHHDAELMLRLYDLRREEKLRKARDWFVREFQAESLEESLRKYPPGSEEEAYVRMTISYWDMACSIVNHGLVQEHFFFESNGELWLVWDKIRHLVPAVRERVKNPHIYGNLETLAKRYEAWSEERAPGNLAVRRQLLKDATKTKPSSTGR